MTSAWFERPWQKVTSIRKSVSTTMAVGLWALIDQAIVSLGTFLAGISLARSLNPSDYGLYALILGIVLSVNGIHTALVTYPMSVRGPTMSPSQLESYAGMAAIWTIILSLPLAIVVALPVYLIGSDSVVPITVLLLMTSQLQETARRALMAHLRHRDALLGDFVRYTGFVAVTWILIAMSEVTLNRVLAAFVVMSSAATVIQMRQLRIRFDHRDHVLVFALGAWKSGKWVFAIMILTFFTVTAFPWTLAVVHDTDLAARYQSIILVLGMVHPVLFSISNAIVPSVARENSIKGLPGALSTAKAFGMQGGILVFPFLLVVVVFARQILSVFFGEASVYADLSTELRVMAVAYCLIYATQVIGGLLSGLELTFKLFAIQLLGSIFAVAVGIPLMAAYGLLGAAIGQVIVYGIQLMIGLAFILRLRTRYAGEISSIA